MIELRQALAEFEHEIVESRNQAIKSDNQVKNLSIEIKRFEQRFDALEHKSKFTSLGMHLLVSLIVISGAYLWAEARTQGVQDKLQAVENRLEAAAKERQLAALEAQTATLKKKKAEAATQKSQSDVLKLVDLIRADHREEALKALLTLNTQVLSPFERRMSDEVVAQFRKRYADRVYRDVRRAMRAKKRRQALVELQKLLKIVDGRGRYAAQARYWLAQLYIETEQYAKVVPVVESLESTETDRALLEEIAFWKATAWLKSGEKKRGQEVLKTIVSRRGAYARKARKLLKGPSTKPVAAKRGAGRRIELHRSHAG